MNQKQQQSSTNHNCIQVEGTQNKRVQKNTVNNNLKQKIENFRKSKAKAQRSHLIMKMRIENYQNNMQEKYWENWINQFMQQQRKEQQMMIELATQNMIEQQNLLGLIDQYRICQKQAER